MDNRVATDLVQLYLTNAFDTLIPINLRWKLGGAGIGDPLLVWLCGFVADRSQQGDRLVVVQYVDDISILSPASDSSSCQHLQDYLEKVEHWALANHLHLSPNKSGVIRFSASRKTDPPAYRLIGAILVPCKTLTILGVVFSSTLDFLAHIAGVVTRARRTLCFVGRVTKSCEPGALRTLYTALVVPTLEYCCSVWSTSQQHLVDRNESVQRRASRTICSRVGGNSFGPDTTYNDRLRTLGWRPLRHRRQVSRVSLACRVLTVI
ncbi:conserved hypothetical protein [Ixodes scapularis]|uniref:Reverse transcriptase domain-containing protein n=1 Tax=Ixodes scapularis TaxID=6945 RepID=B7P320_IXOSC|nr:conserved hypothetical protein [Ixodes scapularis]|eukprot:XP_002403446.1 conserved hypothetical protein [Ixodes scapularis]